MKLKDKMKSLIGMDEDFYDEVEVPTIQAPISHVTPVVKSIEEKRQALRTVEAVKPKSRGVKQEMNGVNMSKVIIREPKSFEDTQNIADCLKENLPVFVNLQRLDKSVGRRVIDFLSGTIYALDGEIQRVGNDLFLCTPNSVETDGTVTETDGEISLSE